jgi:hypothetical protein
MGSEIVDAEMVFFSIGAFKCKGWQLAQIMIEENNCYPWFYIPKSNYFVITINELCR